MIILINVNRNYKKLYDINNIFNFIYKYKNSILDDDEYYEYKKFKDHYICYFYEHNKLSSIIYFNYLEKIHREDGPARIDYDTNGGILNKSYWLNSEFYSYDEHFLDEYFEELYKLVNHFRVFHL